MISRARNDYILYFFAVLYALCALFAYSDKAFAWSDDPSVNTKICPAEYGQFGPSIASDGSGGAIITWTDDDDYNIYAQRITASGKILWGETGLPICETSGFQEYPVIASDGYGGAIIVWQDNRSGNPDIYAQWVNSFGSIIWPTNGIPICVAPEGQYEPIIISDGSGGAIISWKQDVRSGNNDIYAQRVDTSGAKWSTNGVAICTESSGQYNPKMISDGAGGAIFTWKDYRNDDYAVYAQRVNPSGLIQWDPDTGVPISTADNTTQNIAMISDGSGGAIITWDDYYWIYAQRIYMDGKLGRAEPKAMPWIPLLLLHE